MDILNPAEQEDILSRSEIANEYNKIIDRDSAYEMLKGKISGDQEVEDNKQEAPVAEDKSSSIGESIKTIANSSLAKTIFREVTRGLMGVLIGTPKRTTRRKKSLF